MGIRPRPPDVGGREVLQEYRRDQATVSEGCPERRYRAPRSAALSGRVLL